MSVQASSWVWDHSSLSGSALTVLLKLADWTDDHGHNGYGFIEHVAKKARVSKRAAQYAIAKAEEAGELLVFTKAGQKRDREVNTQPNRFDLPKVPGWQPPKNLRPRKDPLGHMAPENGVTPTTPREGVEVQPTAPLEVQPTAPLEVQPTAPLSPRGATHCTTRGATERKREVQPVAPKTSLNTQELKTNGHRQAGDRFDEWFTTWPKEKRVKKKPAREIWRKKKLDRMADRLIEDVRDRLARDRRWREGWIPDPTTYLNQERWEDAIDDRPGGPDGPTGRPRPEPGETPADRNKAATERYFRESRGEVVAADD